MLKRIFEIVKKHDYAVVYAFLALLILSNLLLPGEIFFLDFTMYHDPLKNLQVIAFDYNEDMGGMPADTQEALPYYLSAGVFSFLPVWIVEKLVLFLILFVSGVGMYRACPTENRLGKFFAGLFYMVNPFAYVRFIAGHVFLLLAYAFLPVLAKALFDLLKKEKASVKDCVLAALALWLCTISIHLIPFVFLFVGLVTAFMIFIERNWRVLKRFACVLLLWILLSAPFIVHQLVNPMNETTVLSNISVDDLRIFSTKQDSNANVLYNTASLYGFWRAGYILPKSIFEHVQLIVIAFLFFAVYGALNCMESGKIRGEAYAIILMAVVSFVFAVSTSLMSNEMVVVLLKSFEFVKAFREPHKLLVFLAFGYAFFGGVGVGELLGAMRSKRLQKLAFLLVLVITIVYSFTMFNGFWGQHESKFYPSEYYEAESIFNADDDDFNVLVLPWHLYMDFSWYPKQRLANPARFFFSKPVVSSDAVEVGSIYSQTMNPVSQYIQRILFSSSKETKFGERVALVNVKYVVLLKEVDYSSYSFLYSQRDLKLVEDFERLAVFENEAYKSRVQSMDGARLEYEKQLPVKYALKTSADGVILANGFSEDWKLNGVHASNYSDAVNVFAVKTGGNAGVLEREGWPIAFASFSASVATLVICIALLTRQWL